MLVAEAVAAIERSGGCVIQSIIPTIHFPTAVTVSEEASKAIEFLVTEWHYEINYEDLDDDIEESGRAGGDAE